MIKLLLQPLGSGVGAAVGLGLNVAVTVAPGGTAPAGDVPGAPGGIAPIGGCVAGGICAPG